MGMSITSKSHLKTIRRYPLQIARFNEHLKELHAQLAPSINQQQYIAASTYVNQFIMHAQIWNLKFAVNLENPEIALLQLFHLKFILSNEPEELYEPIRTRLQELTEKFYKVAHYSQEQIQQREEKMLFYIQNFNEQSH